MKKRVLSAIAIGVLAACDSPDDPVELDQTAQDGGKNDSAAGHRKSDRCEVVCEQTNFYHFAMQQLYCTTASLPAWMQPFRAYLTATNPPLPEFSAYTIAGDNKANYGGSWAKYWENEKRNDDGLTPLTAAPDTNPNKWDTNVADRASFAWIGSPAKGAWMSWPLRIFGGDQGASFAVYAYVPPGATNRSATYRVYDGRNSAPVLTHTVDQTDYSGADITLFGLSYNAPGWHFLGQAPLHSGAYVSLDASTGAGLTFGDTVAAFRWGCTN